MPVQPPAPVQPIAEELAGEDEFADEEEEDEDEEAAEPRLSLVDRLKRTPPALVILLLAVVGSTGFLLALIIGRNAPIQALTSAALATGLCYVVVAFVCAAYTYGSAERGQLRRAYLFAFMGGGAAIIAFLSFAGALIMFLALGF